VAVVSDAGSPGISDPGYRLVQRAAELGFPVTAAPGPSAVILSLCLSGLPADRFTFYGFLPKKNREREAVLEEASRVTHTLVFFEAPHRIEKTLGRLLDALGDRRAAVCRELTKRFETIDRGSLAALLTKSRGQGENRGEFCIVIEGRGPEPEPEENRADRLREALEALETSPGKPLKEAARNVAERFALSRREVYQAALTARKEPRKGGAPPRSTGKTQG
jgi:16S rRNA (cytidine1402-2'-O)-methyltransferase